MNDFVKQTEQIQFKNNVIDFAMVGIDGQCNYCAHQIFSRYLTDDSKVKTRLKWTELIASSTKSLLATEKDFHFYITSQTF